jgi:ubiquinone/menaquinone biosynthesis C-methylase UbiE
MRYMDLTAAKQAYSRGENITTHLKEKFQIKENSSAIIEISYDLQAGSYIKGVKSNRQKAELYSAELAEILDQNLKPMDSLLDVGTGELTTLTLMLGKCTKKLSVVLAFDISWSRLFLGKQFFTENTQYQSHCLRAFVADMKAIPLPAKCVDVATSSHALEPNGKNLAELLLELFRVTKRKLVLFEPSYELNSPEGRRRMDTLGYIRGIEQVVEDLGGKILDVIQIKNVSNPLNPTACYVIEPPCNLEIVSTEPSFSVPGTDFPLSQNNTFFLSGDTGLVFPILDNIPILKTEYGILATAKF